MTTPSSSPARDAATITASASAIDVISAAGLQARPSSNRLDSLKNLIPSRFVGQNTISDASSFIRAPSLRALPGDEVLVMLNGKRYNRAALVQVYSGGDTGLSFGSQGADISADPAVAKHKGLTMFIVPLKSDGVEIQPVHTFQEERTNITYYDGVRIPDSYRLGDVNAGVKVMSASLEMEHGASWLKAQRHMLSEAETFCRRTKRAGRAMIEEMAIKRALFGKLDAIAKQGAILASNTSFPDLDAIAAATARPEWVIGLHFLSPANVMRLLEVVRGKATSKEVIATAMKLARQIGKVPVLAGVCDGFIANRVMFKRGEQADAIILEGPTPQQVDKAIFDYGFAMGPFQMMDLVGLDVIGRGDTGRSVRGDLVRMARKTMAAIMITTKSAWPVRRRSPPRSSPTYRASRASPTAVRNPPTRSSPGCCTRS